MLRSLNPLNEDLGDFVYFVPSRLSAFCRRRLIQLGVNNINAYFTNAHVSITNPRSGYRRPVVYAPVLLAFQSRRGVTYTHSHSRTNRHTPGG